MRKHCPVCGHKFAILSEPRLKSWTHDLKRFICNDCGAELAIVGSVRRQLGSLAVYAVAGSLVIAAQWAAYHLMSRPYADVAFFVVGAAIIGAAITVVALSFDYVAVSGTPPEQPEKRAVR